MATITITIDYPDGKAADLRDTIALVEGYQTQILDNSEPPVLINNPETKAQFVQRRFKEVLVQWIKNRYKAQKELEAAAVAPTGDSLGLT